MYDGHPIDAKALSGERAVARPMAVPRTYSENVEMYLKSVFLLAKNGDGRAKTGDISKDLRVSPSSVTEMLDKLQKAGFVRHRKYQGATLTRKGDA